MNTNMDRRFFLKGTIAAAGATALVGLTGCAPSGVSSASVKEEMAQTGATQQDVTGWRKAPEPVSDIASTTDADIVIIGAGNAGLTAAAAALDGGAKVVLLEAKDEVQDSRSWIGAVDSKLQKAAGAAAHADIDHNEATSEIARMASYVADHDLIRLWTDNSGEFMDWFIGIMETQGLNVMLETACKDSIYYNKAVAHHVHQGAYSPTGEGNSFYHHCLALKDYVLANGGEIYFKTPAVQLVQDDTGKVTGVIAQDEDGAYAQFNAGRGVVVCTGGYGNNEEMLEDLTTTAHRYCSMNIGAERNTGDGIKMLTWVGAALHPVQETMVFDRGTVMPDQTLGFPMTGGLWYGGTQPFLRVNADGKRYSNEDQTYDYNFNAAIVQKGHTWWQIFDKNYYADCERFQCARCSRVAQPEEGEAPMISYLDGQTPLSAEFLQSQLEGVFSSGAAVQADTIEGLAELMDVPADALKETVDRYNELWDAQEDTDYGKKAFRLSAIVEPPFTAVHCAGWLLCTLGGVRVNTDMQPLREDGTAIEGVYVVGNDQGGFYGTVYPETFGGLNNGKGMTFGYLVGKALAQA